MMTYTIYMLRHGQTWFNRYNKMQGWSDSPLTPEGEAVARQAAQKLKDVPFAAAFSSDARRAIDTCQIITDANINKNKLHPTKLLNFREEFYGYFEGMFSTEAWYMTLKPHGLKSFQEAAEKVGLDKVKDYMKEADPFHNAENAAEYWQRLNTGFEYLDNIAHENDKILLVSHGTTIQSVAMKYGDGSFKVHEGPANSSLTTVMRKDGQTIVTDYARKLID
ncbi:histidine phosphatase family protein [Bombilactobacillus bombi]|uniref:histidine phosphatase family protein n=1 Tax=Bombilactobacillus bombi TaxID=1303590 RepID=UPI0015E620ED|nr:histidine phosphatase family protein [Bombilactobacillus bombi]MBA1434028.1 histidine phosphatase family protein [Bombilactobacillus bombi]